MACVVTFGFDQASAPAWLLVTALAYSRTWYRLGQESGGPFAVPILWGRKRGAVFLQCSPFWTPPGGGGPG